MIEVPAGWKLVPIEPTWEQRGAAQQAFVRADTDQLGAIYRAMVAASPSFPGENSAELREKQG